MTPLHIEMVIHANTRAPSVKFPNWLAPAQKEYSEWLEAQGLVYLIRDDYGWTGMMRRTCKGRAFLSMLCNTPIPKRAWVDPQGKLIENEMVTETTTA